MHDEHDQNMPEKRDRLASVQEMIAHKAYRPSAIRIADAILVRVGAIALEREVNGGDGRARQQAADARPAA